MKANKSYFALKILLEKKQIDEFIQITTIVTATNLARDHGMNYQTFSRKMRNPGKFTMEEIREICLSIEVDPKIMFNLILRAMEEKPRK